VGAFHFVVNGLADVVEQRALFVTSTFKRSSEAIMPAMWAISMEWVRTFWP